MDSSQPPAPPTTKTLYQGPAPTGKVGPTGLRKGVPARRRDDAPNSSPVLVIVGAVVIVGAAGYLYMRANPDLPLNEQLGGLQTAIQSPFDMLKQKLQLPSVTRSTLAQYSDPRIASPAAASRPSGNTSAAPHKPVAKSHGKFAKKQEMPQEPVVLKNQATVFLANGERVTGELVSDTPESVVLRWEYGDATFKRSEIVHLVKPDEQKTAEPAGHLVTVFLKNGRQMTGQVLYDLPEELILAFEGGEVTFRKPEIERVQPADPLAP